MHVMAELTSMSKNIIKGSKPHISVSVSQYHPLVPSAWRQPESFLSISLISVKWLWTLDATTFCPDCALWDRLILTTPPWVCVDLTDNSTPSLLTSCQVTWDLIFSGGMTQISQSAWWNWQCAMTLCSMNLQLGRKTGPLYHSWCRAQSKVDCSGGGITWPPNMCEFEERTQSNKVQIYGLYMWSRQPGVQCLVHLTYGYELIHPECIRLVFMENTYS